MRTYIKLQIMDLLNSMKQLHNSISLIQNKGQLTQLLANCQDAAIAVGEALERDSLIDHVKIISLLEEYCEEAFNLSESQRESVDRDRISILDNLTESVKTLVSGIFSPYHIVFMPYKASMWDSLESIWRACKDDERCECYVIPIPYYEFNSNTNRWVYCYDGAQFPKEVPIISYEEYSLEQNRPDLAYIHNPYDNLNMVTRVDPRFYSQEVKKYAKNLVYVPYYVTSGFIAQEHLSLSVYQHMDYMVVQSDYAKSFCEDMFYYDRILPLGSPKFDSVIKLCQKGVTIPEPWKPLLDGKKILMLNTSIGCFLRDGIVYLEKIRSLCNTIIKQKQVAVIWRPHPLLEATIKSMRPQLLSEYNHLKEYFLDKKIGVLDDTSDISRAIAISDGYIGEEESSVVNLFGAAGKPIFILDNHITDSFTIEEKCRVHFTDMLINENKYWFTTNRYNALFYMNLKEKQVHYTGRIDNQPKWYSAYPFFTELRNNIYLSPNISGRPAVYDLGSNAFRLIGNEDMKDSARRGLCVSYENAIFYLPIIDNYIAEFNCDTGEWSYYSECIKELSCDVNNDLVLSQGMTFRCSVYGEDIWITATYTNKIIKFNMKNRTYALCQIGSKENGYSGIVAEEKYIWLTEVNSGDIVRWERRSGKVKSFSMPPKFLSWKGNRQLCHISIIDMNKYLVTIPGFSNGMVRLDKITGEVSLIIDDFWKMAGHKVNGYNPEFHFSSSFGTRFDENSIIVQRNYDDAVAIVNVEDETYEMFYPTLSEEDFAKLTEGEDGFEKIDEKSGFFRRESKIFSFEGFIDDLVNDRLTGVRERQLKELSTLAANLDGTCGIKVHEYMMNVLENKDNQ
ncbi:hypothetical protein LXJ15735_03660 [Lacrimispora xylanolytica]